jgi:hypothetical protein
MKKKRSILDRTIALVDKRKTKALEEFCNFDDVSDDLSLIERVFKSDDLSSLKTLSDENFKSLVTKVYSDKEVELVNGLEGAYFLFKNDIALVDSQTKKLNDFVGRVKNLKKKLVSYQDKFSLLDEKIKDYEELEKQLVLAKKEGVISNELVDRISLVLGFDDKTKFEYYVDVLKFNNDSYNALLVSSLESKEEVKILIDIDDLRKVFSKYGYDLSSLDSKYIKALQEEGNLENIEGVFRAITDNRMTFLQEKRKTKLLTQFLLNSNEKIINEVCSVFKDNYVSSSFFTSYLPVFFPSEDRRSTKSRKRKKATDKRDKKEVSDLEDGLTVKGLHKDFIKNLEYMKNNFDVEEKTLLERGIRLLTLTHDALLRHIEELELYGYDIHDSKFPLSAIGASRIMDSTDCFIEVGEENYIKRFASRLLFTCEDIAKRIYAYQESGLEYHSEGRSGAIKTNVINLCSDCEISQMTIDSLVPDCTFELLSGNKYKELLDSYSPRKISDKTLGDPVITSLEERFKVSDSVYKINDITISRRKVLRNYEFLMTTDLIDVSEKDPHRMLLVSAINNSLLTSSEVEEIDRGISEVLGIKGGKNGLSKK